MGQCHLRQNDRDVRDFAKYDGTLEGLLAVQAIIPRGWSSSYTITASGVSGLKLSRGEQNVPLSNGAETYMVVDRFGDIELHDSSSFHFLFNDGETSQFQYDIMVDDGFLWGG